MHSPIREQIKLSDLWHVRTVNEHEAAVFVPGPWGSKQVVLISNGGSQEAQLLPGQWNQVTVATGSIAGARLVASSPLHIVLLQASATAPESLSVRVRLAETAAADPVLSLFLTLTAPDGTQVAGTGLALERSTRELSTLLPCSRALSGTYRLKAALCAHQSVIDNARTEVTV